MDRDHGRHDAVAVRLRKAAPKAIDPAGLAGVLASGGDQRMFLEREADCVAGEARRDEVRGQAGLRNVVRNLATALTSLHPADGRSQHIAGPLCGWMRRACEDGKYFRPIAELAHCDIDLQRIDRAVDQDFEWPERAPAVEAEQ